MRYVVTALTAVAILFAASGAFAQDGDGGDGEKSKFYDFDDMTVNGELKTPDVQRMEARGEAKFKRLLELKKSFLPKVQKTTAEDALQ